MLAVFVSAQEPRFVRVTVPTANVRSQPSESAPIVDTVSWGKVLELKSEEGEWYFVSLPPDPRLSGARVQAYISKKVARLETGTPPADVAAATPAVPSADDRVVQMEAAGAEVWLPATTLRVVYVADAASTSTLAGLATLDAVRGAFGGAAAQSVDPSALVTYLWAAPARPAPRAAPARRPTFTAFYGQIAGVDPEVFFPALVKLVTVGAVAQTDAPAWRLVAAARGRADAPAAEQSEWDVMREFKQAVVPSDLRAATRGIVRITPKTDLAPGDYAVVLRSLVPGQKFAGLRVFGGVAEGRAFGRAWAFAIK